MLAHALRRRTFSRFRLLTILLLVCVALGAGAQTSQDAVRIGFLSPTSPEAHGAALAAFLQGLRDNGYQEGLNLTIEYRWAREKTDRLPDLANELVRLKVRLIVTHSSAGALAAKRATKAIPIVFAAVGDPVRNGIVASLARPGGNITGLSFQDTELDVKRFEYLKQTAPGILQVALLRPRQVFRDDEVPNRAAGSLGLKASNVLIDGEEDLARAFSEAGRQGAQAMFLSNSSLLRAYAEKIAAVAIQHRLPTVGAPSFAERGILLGYGANLEDVYRRAGGYVSRILKGARPADLPIEQPTKFELVVNLRTARALGITIPQTLLARADRVID